MAAAKVHTNWVGNTAVLHIPARSGPRHAAEALREAVGNLVGAVTPGEWLRAERAHGGKETLGRLAAEALGQPYDKATRATKEYKAELRALQRLAKENGQHHARPNAERAARLREVSGKSGVRNPFSPPPEVRIEFAARGEWSFYGADKGRSATPRLGTIPRDDLSRISGDRDALASMVPGRDSRLERLDALQAQITFA